MSLSNYVNSIFCCDVNKVLQEYGREKLIFLQKVFENRKYLEEVTSLSLYQLIDDQFDVSTRQCYY